MDNVVQEECHFHEGNRLGKQALIQTLLLKSGNHCPGAHCEFGVQSQHAVLPFSVDYPCFPEYHSIIGAFCADYVHNHCNSPLISFHEEPQYYRHCLHSFNGQREINRKANYLWRQFWLQDNADLFMLFPASSPLESVRDRNWLLVAFY